MKTILTVACAMLATTSAYAQASVPTEAPVQPVTTVQHATQAAAIAAPITTHAVLRSGTPVALIMSEEITTKKKAAKVGQRFRLEVSAPVEVNGVVVIPAGSPAWGELTNVRNKGMWGKSGKLEARLLSVRVNGRQIRLSGAFDDKGVTGTAGVVGSIALVPLAGFFVTGTSAELPMGGAVKGFIDEDVELSIAAAAPAPLEINAPPAVLEIDASVSGEAEG